MKNNWRVWDTNKTYGETLQKRADGTLKEMESSKSLCEVMKPYYSPGMTIVDIGCGAGHYLRSLRKRIDPEIKYTGIDATEYYVKLAQETFPDRSFKQGDIFDLPVADGKFDIVMCNNLLLHLPPPPMKPISELIRITKRYLFIRTVFGERNYVIKEVREPDEWGCHDSFKTLFDDNGFPNKFNYFNMYNEKYLCAILDRLAPDKKVTIIKDKFYQSFDNTKIGGSTATKVENGKQISGNLLLDWRFIILEK